MKKDWIELDPYGMELHEIRSCKGEKLTRVPGGWLYQSWDWDNNNWRAAVYVPYNNEFQGRSET